MGISGFSKELWEILEKEKVQKKHPRAPWLNKSALWIGKVSYRVSNQKFAKLAKGRPSIQRIRKALRQLFGSQKGALNAFESQKRGSLDSIQQLFGKLKWKEPKSYPNIAEFPFTTKATVINNVKYEMQSTLLILLVYLSLCVSHSSLSTLENTHTKMRHIDIISLLLSLYHTTLCLVYWHCLTFHSILYHNLISK